jgi:hypothetical protein
VRWTTCFCALPRRNFQVMSYTHTHTLSSKFRRDRNWPTVISGVISERVISERVMAFCSMVVFFGQWQWLLRRSTTHASSIIESSRNTFQFELRRNGSTTDAPAPTPSRFFCFKSGANWNTPLDLLICKFKKPRLSVFRDKYSDVRCYSFHRFSTNFEVTFTDFRCLQSK